MENFKIIAFLVLATSPLASLSQCSFLGYEYGIGQTIEKRDGTQWECKCLDASTRPGRNCIYAQFVEINLPVIWDDPPACKIDRRDGQMAYYDITVYPGETLRVAYNSHPAKETSLRIMRRRTIIHYINPMFPKDDYIFTLEATSQDTLRIEVKVKKKPDGHHKWHRYHTWIGHQQFTKDSTFVQTIMFDIEQCEDEDDLSHSAFRGRIGIRNGERVG